MTTRSGSSTVRSTRESTSSTPPTSTRPRVRVIVGKALAPRPRRHRARDEGSRPGRRPQLQRNSRRWIMKSREQPAAARTDYIDLYQIHRRARRHRRDARRADRPGPPGKIRGFGRSTFPPGRSSRRSGPERAAASVSCEQPPYSMLVRASSATSCRPPGYGMGVFPWSPLAGGWLSGGSGKGKEHNPARERLPARYDLSLPGNQRNSRSRRGRGRRRGGSTR